MGLSFELIDKEIVGFSLSIIEKGSPYPSLIKDIDWSPYHSLKEIDGVLLTP